MSSCVELWLVLSTLTNNLSSGFNSESKNNRQLLAKIVERTAPVAYDKELSRRLDTSGVDAFESTGNYNKSAAKSSAFKCTDGKEKDLLHNRLI